MKFMLKFYQETMYVSTQSSLMQAGETLHTFPGAGSPRAALLALSHTTQAAPERLWPSGRSRQVITFIHQRGKSRTWVRKLSHPVLFPSELPPVYFSAQKMRQKYFSHHLYSVFSSTSLDFCNRSRLRSKAEFVCFSNLTNDTWHFRWQLRECALSEMSKWPRLAEAANFFEGRRQSKGKAGKYGRGWF